MHLVALQCKTRIQQQRDKWHDCLIKKKNFSKVDWVLLSHSRFKDFLSKLQIWWLGPYEVKNFYDNGMVCLTMIDDVEISFLVNGNQLILHHQPLIKE